MSRVLMRSGKAQRVAGTNFVTGRLQSRLLIMAIACIYKLFFDVGEKKAVAPHQYSIIRETGVRTDYGRDVYDRRLHEHGV